MTGRLRSARPRSSSSTRSQAGCAWRGRSSRSAASRRVPSTEPSTKPITFGDGPAPGCPCRCTPNSLAACMTTPPPRCDEWWWSCSPWGWLSISRGNPGPEVISRSAAGGSEERIWRKEKLQNSSQDEARNRGLRLGGCACRRNVIATAIEERCAFCGSEDAAAGAGESTVSARGCAGCALRRTVIAFAIGARGACCSHADASATARARRR
jgi:hypothetical protein